MTPVGEDSWKLVSDFLRPLPHEPFPFANFALCPFDEIIRSHEYDYMLSPVSSPIESLNLRQAIHIISIQHSSLHITQREHVSFSLPGQSFQCWVCVSRMGGEWNFA